MPKAKSGSTKKILKSAVTGKIVSAEQAKKNPKTTFAQTVTKKKKAKKS